MQRARSSWKAKLFLIVLWINFAALWIRVYGITPTGDVTDSFRYLGGLISAYGMVMTWWIFHNIRIYRIKGNRSVKIVSHTNTHDALQRYISRKANLQRGQEIVVDVFGDRKIFVEVARPEATPVFTHGTR